MSTLAVQPEPPSPDITADYATRIQIDRSCRQTVLGYYASAVAWLLIGSLAALITSIKLHHPEFLGGCEWITFGRIRPVHLNTVVYGWSSMVGIGTTLWLEAPALQSSTAISHVTSGDRDHLERRCSLGHI